MDNIKFGLFIANRRKELNMTQKDLADKIQVTDKAISKWERGLGFPDINTIEDLANALNVSIVDLMKSEKIDKEMQESETEIVVNNVVDVAKSNIDNIKKSIIYTFSVTTVLLSILEILLSINWENDASSLNVNIPWAALVPAVILVVYGLVCKIKQKKNYGAIYIGLCLLLIPVIITGVSFFICEIINH